MKRIPFLVALHLIAGVLLGGAAPVRAQSTVLISELCDPRLNYLTDRFLEIANVGAAPVDLTGWSLVAVGNGADIFTWNLSGTIAPGEALVAGDATTVTTFPVDFPDEAWSANNATWNGKVGDGARLLGPGAVEVDVIVATGTTFENEDLTRNPSVLMPTVTYDPAQWYAVEVDLATQGTPGTHVTDPAPQGPTVSGVVTSPLLPTAADAVHVLADVSDSVATIVSVELHWGLSPAAITNVVPMSVLSGSTYRTDSPVPAQAQGSTVHYEVHATNDVPATTVIDFLSYDVPFEVPIASIQGMAASSPYDGEVVLTGGVVTGTWDSYLVLQDGAGAWSGIWVRTADAAAIGDSVTVRGRVTESDPAGFAGNTLVDEALVVAGGPGGSVPAPVDIASADIALESWEGVFVRVPAGQCIDPNVGLGEWDLDDGSGVGRVGDRAHLPSPVLGTVYDVVGCAGFSSAVAKIEPRAAGDVTWVSDGFAPVVVDAAGLAETTVLVTFSEEVDPATSETASHYGVSGLSVLSAARNGLAPEQVTLTVSSMTPGVYTLTVNGVEDLYGNVAIGETEDFSYIPVPPGYYDSAEGLSGEPLRAALHEIIDDHTAVPYSGTWVSFYTTDDKPNGTVWDMYSDVPGGTPPYEYTFGVDQGGVGGVEGTGYNREHSWPQSWFNELAPMRSDLFQLYPTDNWVNNQRGSFPYGEVGSPTWTSLNGSRLGPCSYPGYSGTAFEPIDEYKGDFARTYFYMTARYYTEDAGWQDTDMTSGADLLPWAIAMLLEWHEQDPVSEKEVERNAAVYDIQLNRNPFIDRPEFALRMLSTAAGAGPVVAAVPFELRQNAPNPFGAATRIGFSVPARSRARLDVYDVTGRLVARLLDGTLEAGRHEVEWAGRNGSGARVAPGVYFYRVEAGGLRATRRMVRVR